MRKATVFLIAVLVIAGFSGSALAWSNHTSIAGNARSAANYTGFYACNDTNGYLVNGAGWADGSTHADGSGSLYYDEEYNHHSCAGFGDMAHFRKATYGLAGCGWDSGDAHTNAQGFFNVANSYITISPSLSRKILGRGQHYIEDVGNPWHSSTALSTCHAAVESWMSSYYYSKGFSTDVYNGARYAKFNAPVTTNKSSMVQSAANQSWSTGYWLVCGNFSSSDSTWHTIMYWTGYYNFAYYKPICS